MNAGRKMIGKSYKMFKSNFTEIYFYGGCTSFTQINDTTSKCFMEYDYNRSTESYSKAFVLLLFLDCSDDMNDIGFLVRLINHKGFILDKNHSYSEYKGSFQRFEGDIGWVYYFPVSSRDVKAVCLYYGFEDGTVVQNGDENVYSEYLFSDSFFDYDKNGSLVCRANDGENLKNCTFSRVSTDPLEPDQLKKVPRLHVKCYQAKDYG
ncbi:DgyrCDS4132 [Dimorphilus gyrociliatus]|uniref:DgyrCDS4132 n=1 Tax=Dimorphilus gyrociliatus TaxID=2664684 RepID=A0A7I8VFR0_9ANNE|nr:DgyrCDS4132 [Dimorphilus gyrociliatus]